MATYREIKGLRVPYLDADLPSASASSQEGSVWYNSSTGKLRAFLAYDTWATGSSLNTARKQVPGDGTQNAAYVVGGSAVTANHEHYNGSGWSEQANLNTARRNLGSFGTQTSAVAFGGQDGDGTVQAINESWNGTAWTEVADMATARALGSSTPSGTSSAAFVTGSSDPGYTAATEEWTVPEALKTLASTNA